MHTRRLLLLITLGLAGCPRPADGATFRGRIIDGPTYEGRIVNGDHGAYDVTVQFDDDRARLKFRQGGRMIVHLEDIDIDDPSDITVTDRRYGVTWSLRVAGLNR